MCGWGGCRLIGVIVKIKRFCESFGGKKGNGVSNEIVIQEDYK